MFCHFRIRLELFEEIGIFRPSMFGLPGLHRVALDQFIRLLAREAFANERQQHRLRVPHAERKRQIARHVVGIDDQPLRKLCQRRQHIIQQCA